MRYLFVIFSFIAVVISSGGVTQEKAAHPKGQLNCGEAPSYQKGRIAHSAPGYPREVSLYISIESKHFVEKDMRALACELKSLFPSELQFSAIILDDEDALRHTSPIHRTREFMLARRGYYHIDRITGEEYIEFSPARGKPFDEVKISLAKSQQ